MATQADRVENRLAGERLPDERVLYAILAFRAGGVRKTMIGGAAGLGGLLGAAAMAAASTTGRPATPAVLIPLPSQIIVSLTDQRLLLFKNGGVLVAKPTTLLHSYTLDRLAWVSEPELIPGVAQALRVQIGVAAEGVLAIEFPRLMVTEGRNMINRLRRMLPAEPDSEVVSGDPTS